ncbi:MAG: NUDIX hydrolase [Sulfobacillus benefaciens]|uniref:NUDIX hydrolase n=1 Tax=Sulfobacillus benefaciens TaxID=453960 RepID=A0A2T2XAA6_9FIRM|nr:MAG: NUDIX hydrolase [Sulfobacillus benefaciens]
MPRPHPPKQPIKIPDLSGRIHEFPPQEVRFRPGAYGLLIQDDKILLSLSKFTEKWDLPGGGTEPWESLESGLVREFFEETGLTVQIKTMIGMRESFITFFRYPFHSLRFYYQVQTGSELPESLVPESQELLDLKWWDLHAIPVSRMNEDDLDIIRQALK